MLKRVYHMRCGEMIGWTIAEHRQFSYQPFICCMCGERTVESETFTVDIPER